MGTGIGIDAIADGDGWIGHSALDARLIELGRYQSLGIIRGCKVNTSSTGMRYTIGSGAAPVSLAVASRGGADGAMTMIIPPGTVNTAAAPASGARIDVVWAKQNRPDLGDANNQVVTGVTSGAASANPSEPTIPVGALALAYYRVPAGITATSGATQTDVGKQAVPYGAAKGVLVEQIYTNTNETIPTSTPKTIISTSFALGSPRKLMFQITASCLGTSATDKSAVIYRLVVDGVEKREVQFTLDQATGIFQYTEFEQYDAGRHTVQLRAVMNNGTGQFKYTAGRWPGQKITIVDNGVDDG